MALQSMTGFARREGTSGRWRWAWELRSVNGKGLDVRCACRPASSGWRTTSAAHAGEQFSRGNMQASLSVSAGENRFETVLNQEALAAVLALCAISWRHHRSGTAEARHAACHPRHRRFSRDRKTAPRRLRCARCGDHGRTARWRFRSAAMREHEGAALGRVLLDQVDHRD
jgi:uncharacterized protein YicC (UPF0701 family)